MTTSWSAVELDRIESPDELEIAVPRADGTLRRWVPIWVVRVGDRVYVRTWHRRETGSTPRKAAPSGERSDLNMLVNVGGRERTAAEFRAPLASAGFSVTAMSPLPPPAAITVIEAVVA